MHAPRLRLRVSMQAVLWLLKPHASFGRKPNEKGWMALACINSLQSAQEGKSTEMHGDKQEREREREREGERETHTQRIKKDSERETLTREGKR